MNNKEESHDKLTLFVQVALPLPLDTFTYRVPFELNETIQLGQLVAVHFGRRIKKMYGGIVTSISEQPPKGFQASYIQEIIDEEPLISEQQLSFWKWISTYYLAKLGDVMVAALPSGLRLTGETRIYYNPEEIINPNSLDPMEIQIISMIEDSSYITPEQIQKQLSITNPLKFIRSLYEKGLIKVADEINRNFKPKTKTHVKLSFSKSEEKQLELHFEQVKRSPKQAEVLLYLINLGKEIDKKDLMNSTGVSSAVLASMSKKGIITIFQKTFSRFELLNNPISEISLSAAQEKAVEEIEIGFKEKKPVLLYAPTASGKTYIYLNLIQKALNEGKQALYLLPEIALTEQVIQKLQEFLGEEVLVTHSKYSTQERAEIWELLRSKAVNVIVGPRSTIFSPFFDLDLIVVDEEHENSFKQNDKSPRFNGRDAAIVLAKKWGAKVILGSATPSIESMYAAKNGKFKLVQLTSRFVEEGSINYETVNLKTAKEKNKMNDMFTFEMIEALNKTLSQGKQAIIFHNRKGFVPITNCTSCGWVPHCINCDIALTYYKYNDEMRCHYCGFRSKPPSQCADCGSHKLEVEGFGTEKITEDLKKILPEINIERFDQESTRKKKAHSTIIEGFKSGEIQILVGTQLLAKGFDFEKVDFVGVVNADHMLHFPDFRSGERTFQLLTQVAGRTGRRERDGQVMLQTYRPDHPVIEAIIHSDYERLYETEIRDRQNFLYPPFSRLVLIQVKDFHALTVEKAGYALANKLKEVLGHRVIGPAKPAIAKINRWYIREILIRIDKKNDNLLAIKNQIQETCNTFNFQTEFKKTRVIINVDPV